MLRGNDALAEWTKNRPSGFFLPSSDNSVIRHLPQINNWVNSHFTDVPAKSKFFRDADPFLIAYAREHGYTVVTHEKYSENTTKVKIPNVCIQFGVPYVNTFEMMRLVGIELKI
ncbi:MAG: DUF4411 family protein [Armatimonadetes bacterium]|nr:DUF4411 family protein [Armatimonadota bacterium]